MLDDHAVTDAALPVPATGGLPTPASLGPLTGLTVVSVEQAVAAPFATRQLADLGTRVIKVERPGSGDFARHYDATVKGLASYFVWLNRLAADTGCCRGVPGHPSNHGATIGGHRSRPLESRASRVIGSSSTAAAGCIRPV